MPRVAKPYPFRGWYVSRAGGSLLRLCPVADGEARAAELLARLRPPPAAKPARKPGRNSGPFPDGGLTVAAVSERFLAHAETYYRLPSGEVSREVYQFRVSFRELLAVGGGVARPADAQGGPPRPHGRGGGLPADGEPVGRAGRPRLGLARP